MCARGSMLDIYLGLTHLGLTHLGLTSHLSRLACDHANTQRQEKHL